MSKPKGYVDPKYLQATGDRIKKLKDRTYQCMKVAKGHKVLDVGCGPGADTISLAQLVESSGKVCGVDYDGEMILAAKRNAENLGVSFWVEHEKADASFMPFEDDYFDSCRSERLFQHLQNPTAALSEMVRVTKDGGWIVVLDPDWGSVSIDTDEIDIERRLFRFHADQMTFNGYSGRKLYRLFKQQSLNDVFFEIFPVAVTSYSLVRQMLAFERLEKEIVAKGVVTNGELNHLLNKFERAEAEGVFFGYVNIMLVAGRK